MPKLDYVEKLKASINGLGLVVNQNYLGVLNTNELYQGRISALEAKLRREVVINELIYTAITALHHALPVEDLGTRKAVACIEALSDALFPKKEK